MAWTPEKNIVLRDLIKERVGIEQNVEEILQWELTRSWLQIIGSYVTNPQKQSMLNDFIDDKVVYLNKVITAQQTLTSSTMTSRDSLITLKE